MRVALLSAIIIATLVALPAAGQEQTGGVRGVVKDSSGSVLAGVTVEARSPAVVGVSTTVTDAEGSQSTGGEAATRSIPSWRRTSIRPA
jgi:hypothetical protein